MTAGPLAAGHRGHACRGRRRTHLPFDFQGLYPKLVAEFVQPRAVGRVKQRPHDDRLQRSPDIDELFVLGVASEKEPVSVSLLQSPVLGEEQVLWFCSTIASTKAGRSRSACG
jgi:hypothetical protein